MPTFNCHFGIDVYLNYRQTDALETRHLVQRLCCVIFNKSTLIDFVCFQSRSKNQSVLSLVTSVRLTAYLHVTIWKTQNGFLRKLTLKSFTKICRHMYIFIKIGQKQAVYSNTYVLFWAQKWLDGKYLRGESPGYLS